MRNTATVKNMKYTRELITERFNKGERLKYIFFWGHKSSVDGSITKSCFSQWWSCKFTVDGIEYHTAEQYMMAQKALLFGDEKILAEIMDIWDKNCCDIVVKGNVAKFSQNGDLKAFLLNTNSRILVEASPYDKMWGIGMGADDPRCENPTLWNGTNFLGFCLMEVRDFIREGL